MPLRALSVQIFSAWRRCANDCLLQCAQTTNSGVERSLSGLATWEEAGFGGGDCGINELLGSVDGG